MPIDGMPGDRGADAPRDPQYEDFRIDTIWAYTIVGDDSEEGIPADKARLDSLRPWAQLIANQYGRPCRLTAFTTRHDLDVIQPE